MNDNRVEALIELSEHRRRRMARLLEMDAPLPILLTEMRLVVHADICRGSGRRVSKWWVTLAMVHWCWREIRSAARYRWDEWIHRAGACNGLSGENGESCWVCEADAACSDNDDDCGCTSNEN